VKSLQLPDEVRSKSLSTEELRQSFLLESLFVEGRIELVYVDLDRTVIGGAMPLAEPLALPCPRELRAELFLERRELGVLNIGGAGAVEVDGVHHELDKLDALYVGRSAASVTFHSRQAEAPACFYLLSYPAHAISATFQSSSTSRVPAAVSS
jgi:4-deoxy-L-threo-5-hexosulose-uronate ketol-isomerase